MGRTSDIEEALTEWRQQRDEARDAKKRFPEWNQYLIEDGPEAHSSDEGEDDELFAEGGIEQRMLDHSSAFREPPTLLKVYIAFKNIEDTLSDGIPRAIINPRTAKDYAILYAKNLKIAEQQWDAIGDLDPREILADSIPAIFPTPEERQEFEREVRAAEQKSREALSKYRRILCVGEIAFEDPSLQLYFLPDIQTPEQIITAEQHAKIFDHLQKNIGTVASNAYRAMVHDLPKDFSTQSWRDGLLSIFQNNWEYTLHPRREITFWGRNEELRGSQLREAFQSIYGESQTERGRKIFLQASEE